MSMSPTASRFLEWRERHAASTDIAFTIFLEVIAFLLILNAPAARKASFLGQDTASLSTDQYLVNAAVILLCTLAMAWRRHAPRTVWLIFALLPPLHVALAIQICGFGAWASIFGGYAPIVFLGMPVQIATLAMRLHLRWIAAAVLLSSLSAATLPMSAAHLPGDRLLLLLQPFLLVNIIGALVGLLLAFYNRQLHILREEAQRRALAQEQSLLLAAATERSRIARDMHDIVAHSLAVMITMADGAAASLPHKPDTARQALEILSNTGRSALADTRRLVGVLRHDPLTASAAGSPSSSSGSMIPDDERSPSGAPRQPDPSVSTREGAPAQPTHAPRGGPAPGTAQPGCAIQAAHPDSPQVRDLPVPEFAPPGTVARQDTPPQVANLRAQAVDETQEEAFTAFSPVPQAHEIEHLVERFRAAGVPATYRWEGAELPDNPGLNLALYRIAQEALTNVLRYAPRTPRVSVEVIRSLGRVELVVCNDAAPGTEAMPGSGKGIIGMRERAAAYQGRVEAGPTATGWRVQASLHWDESEHSTHTWEVPR